MSNQQTDPQGDQQTDPQGEQQANVQVDQQADSQVDLQTARQTGQQIVVAVKLRYNPKAFWFDPVLSSYQTGDHVLVDTDRGREVGLVVEGELTVTTQEIAELKTPLKPVIRVLSGSDYDVIDELDAKGQKAMPVFRELIAKHELDIKPVSVEYLFTGDKAVFYFSSDERVDFRELVRDLASHFHIRIDMRQIGVRDEARILGGLAHCGEELCCTRIGGEFQPVSIRIAKEQDLPLNPVKISGACGRLMCCLRYEFEAYKDFKGRAPKRGTLIETPLGQAKVIDYDTPREVIMMRLEDGKQLAIPLSEFDCCADEAGRKHPCSVSKDAISRCSSSSTLMALSLLEQESAQEEQAALRLEQAQDGQGGERDRTTRRRRSGKRKTEEGVAQSAAQGTTKGIAQGAATQPVGKGGGAKRTSRRLDTMAPRRAESATENKPKQRPGQFSSALRNPRRTHTTGDTQQGQQGDSAGKDATNRDATNREDAASPASKNPSEQHRRWRRTNTPPTVRPPRR